jgi:hypothetical protein
MPSLTMSMTYLILDLMCKDIYTVCLIVPKDTEIHKPLIVAKVSEITRLRVKRTAKELPLAGQQRLERGE